MILTCFLKSCRFEGAECQLHFVATRILTRKRKNSIWKSYKRLTLCFENIKLCNGQFNFQLFPLFFCHFYFSPRFEIWQRAVVCASGQAGTWIYICMMDGTSQVGFCIFSALKESARPLPGLSSVFFCLTHIDENAIRFTADFLPIFLIFSIPLLWLCCLLYCHLLTEPIYTMYK
jgi:hypothetical protein